MNYIDDFTGGNTNYNLDDIMRVQESNQAAINDMFADYENLPQVSATNKSFIISGCSVTLSEGVTIAIASGYYYSGVSGAVIKVDAQSISHTIGKFYHLLPTTTYNADGDKTFADGVARQTWRNERGVLTQYDTEQTTLYDVEQYLSLNDIIGKIEFRYDSIIDYDQTDLTEGAWVTLNLSTKVPTGTRRILATIEATQTTGINDSFDFRVTGETEISYLMRLQNNDTEKFQILLPISRDRKIDVWSPNSTNFFEMQIDGYQ